MPEGACYAQNFLTIKINNHDLNWQKDPIHFY
jgi:hypothetical protein